MDKLLTSVDQNSDNQNRTSENSDIPSPYQTPVINISSLINSNNWENTPSPCHLTQTIDGVINDDDDKTDELDEDEVISATNPEPPKELIDEHLLDADNIGDTVFSKRWVLSALLKILKYVEDDSINKLEVIDEGFQDDICRLWDMSMNEDVVTFLAEHQSIGLFIKCLDISNSLRAKEMCIGILGNMMCSQNVFKMFTADDELITFLISLLQCDDPPMLIETLRLLTTCISYEDHCEPWIIAITKASYVLSSILFILQSSTNANLLKSTAEFVSKLLGIDDKLCIQWSCPEMVLAVLEAFKQTGLHESHLYSELMNVLQCMSTNENGVQALVTYAGEICMLSIGYLKNLCDDVLVVVVGNENVIASTVSVLNVLFLHWDANADFINQDYSFIRIVLKFLEALNKLPYSYDPDEISNDDDSEIIQDDFNSDKNHPIYRMIHSLLLTLLKDILNILQIGLLKQKDAVLLKQLPRSLEYIERHCNKNRLVLISSCLNNVDVWIDLANNYNCCRFKQFLIEHFNF